MKQVLAALFIIAFTIIFGSYVFYLVTGIETVNEVVILPLVSIMAYLCCFETQVVNDIENKCLTFLITLRGTMLSREEFRNLYETAKEEGFSMELFKEVFAKEFNHYL